MEAGATAGYPRLQTDESKITYHVSKRNGMSNTAHLLTKTTIITFTFLLCNVYATHIYSIVYAKAQSLSVCHKPVWWTGSETLM